MEKTQGFAKPYLWLIVGIFGLTAVGLGALGAHAFSSILSTKAMGYYKTAVHYQFYHTFAMALALYFFERDSKKVFLWAYRFFAIGVLLFSGSLYLYVFTLIKFLAMVTPFGGVSFMIGWLLIIVAFACYKKKHQ